VVAGTLVHAVRYKENLHAAGVSNRRNEPMRKYMRLNSKLFRITAALAAIFVAGAFLTESSGATAGGAQGKKNRYIGAAKCKNCHNKEETGDQYGIWLEKSHSHAFKNLGEEPAKQAGAARGIEDPQKADDCVQCHVTAFGLPKEKIKKGFKPELGVQCESCHGPGEKHMMARMRAAGDDTDEYPDIPEDELVPVKVATCLECHNEKSPTFKPFCAHERFALIRHLNPEKPRTEAELAALVACSCKAECVCKKDSEGGVCRDAEK
jgi:hypothetical protein